MNNFIKKNWFKIAIIIILTLALFFYFYWNNIRKSKIKHDCYNTAIYWSGKPSAKSETYNKIFNFHYENCLKNSGY